MRKRKRENGLHELLKDREVGSWQYYRSVKHRQILEMLPTDESDEFKEAIGDFVHSKVDKLDLRNKISDEGVEAVAKALKDNSVLQELDLRSNNISDEGVEALADAMKLNSVLQESDLRSNNTSAEGAKAMAEALKVNLILWALALRSNNISDEGVEALAEALEVNSALQNLDLRSNKIRRRQTANQE